MSPALPGVPQAPLAPPAPALSLYLESLLKSGNPCYACGAKNPFDLRRCRRCSLPLPSSAPLSRADAEKVVDRSFRTRLHLRWFNVLSFALIFSTIPWLQIVGRMAWVVASWTNLYLWVAVAGGLLAGAMAVFVYKSMVTRRILRVQSLLYKRHSSARLAHRKQLRAEGRLAPPWDLSVPPRPGTLPNAPPTGSNPASPAGTARAFSPLGGNTAVLEPGFRLRGVNEGLGGRFWTVRDEGKRVLLQLFTDAKATKVSQLMASDAEAAERYELTFAVFSGGRRVGSLVDRCRVDDVGGIGSSRRTILDERGGEILRLESAFPTFPTSLPALLWSYRSVRAYAGGTSSAPALVASPDCREEQLGLEGPDRQPRASASPLGRGWRITRTGGSGDPIPMLAMVGMASWAPDGVTFALARKVSGNLDLAEALLNA